LPFRMDRVIVIYPSASIIPARYASTVFHEADRRTSQAVNASDIAGFIYKGIPQ